MKHKNKPKHTPTPLLALYMSSYNARRPIKQMLADARASLADRLYAISYRPRRRERL